MLKTTLVYAGIIGKGFDSIGQGMDSGWISHGLASLAACTREAGFDVDLIDLRALRDWEHFRDELEVREPDVCGLTMMSVDFNPVMKCVDVIKSVNPEITVVVGGPHPTLATGEVEANPKVDYIVTREGEITFLRLLEAIRDGCPPADRVLRGEMPDLNLIPYPDHDLFVQEWRKRGYTLDSPEVPFGEELPPPFVTVIAGRGCIYNCSFCQPAERKIFGRKVRRRTVENVIRELCDLRDRYQFASFMFHDDCLTEDRHWVTSFCEAYRTGGFNQPFFCQSRADIVVHHPDVVALMAEVGLKGLFVGFESGNDRVLRFIRKGSTRDLNLEAARICRRLGVKVWANYMLGVPTETEEEIRDTISMLKEIDPDYYSPAFYTPHPGSDLYDYCMEHDLSLVSDHDSYRRNPDEVKIKGHDYDFLRWALEESQRRTMPNRIRRKAGYYFRRYVSPRKVVRKLERLLGG